MDEKVPDAGAHDRTPPDNVCFVPWCGELAAPGTHGLCARHRAVELRAAAVVADRHEHRIQGGR